MTDDRPSPNAQLERRIRGAAERGQGRLGRQAGGVANGGLASALGIDKGTFTVLFREELALPLNILDAAMEIFHGSIVAPRRQPGLHSSDSAR